MDSKRRKLESRTPGIEPKVAGHYSL